MSVRDLIQQGESQHVEFKESFSADNKAIESLCAFSNSQGGTVLVGVSDVGAVVGASLGKNTLENFANKLAQHTQPPLYVCLTTEQVDPGTVVVISVKAHRQGELFYAFGKPFIRVGKTNQVMSPQEQKERLLMGQSETPWIVRAGGPEFRLMPGFKGRELKLGCSFQITGRHLLAGLSIGGLVSAQTRNGPNL